jgi:hypothetical protein
MIKAVKDAAKKKRRVLSRYSGDVNPPKIVDKSIIYIMADMGVYISDIAEAMDLRPQKVLDILSERRKSNDIQNL